MNPSSTGWIAKYGHLVKDNTNTFADFRSLYGGLKKTGFVYGINLAAPRFIKPEHKLTEDENAKINLLTSLYFTFKLESGETSFDAFTENVLQFYKDLEVGTLTFLEKLFTGNTTVAKLEKLIDSRVYLEDNVLSKTFNSLITNSLLFIDTLTYKQYLKDTTKIKEYAQLLEYLTINVSHDALSSKESNKKDQRLQELFAASLTFVDYQADFEDDYKTKLPATKSVWEKRYLLDVACLTVWEDKKLDYTETDFVFTFGERLGFKTTKISNAMEEITYFFDKNSAYIPFLKDTNLAFQFYGSMAKVVDKLIKRNSKRLLKELLESKELVSLLTKSTVRELSAEEKKKVQNQLLDIFKSIPSLAIFLLPGGAVLLPVFIKLIPKLLPSSFDENRVEKE